jgi:hypothetical protein
MTNSRNPRFALRILAAGLCGGIAIAAAQVPAQVPAPAPAAPAANVPATPAPPSLASLAWLAGCWQGAVNMRDFREQWMPLRGGLIVGASHTVIGERTQNFEYMRIEARPDGIFYVVAPSGANETAFRLTGETSDGEARIFTFSNPGNDFPQTIIYRRDTKGWLYAHVEGKLKGADTRVIYPMRRVDCETGENIDK